MHCHSARHVLVKVVTPSSPFGQRIVGTQEETKNDFDEDVCSANNNTNERGAQKGAPSRRRWCRRSLKLDSLLLFISREECVIFMKGKVQSFDVRLSLSSTVDDDESDDDDKNESQQLKQLSFFLERREEEMFAEEDCCCAFGG